MPIEETRAKIEIANLKQGDNIRITWAMRDIGKGVSSNAHLGKRMAEVTTGDHNRDPGFQLYDVSSVTTIMKHEPGLHQDGNMLKMQTVSCIHN